MSPAATTSASLALAGAMAFALVYLKTKFTLPGGGGLAVPEEAKADVDSEGSDRKEDTELEPSLLGTAVGAVLAAVSSVWVFVRDRIEGRPLLSLEGQQSLMSGYRESGYSAASQGDDQGPTQGAGKEYARRVELRRNIASLQNTLGYTEDQLSSMKRQLKREKERADRAESLYLKQKSALQLLEIENQRLRAEMRPFRRG